MRRAAERLVEDVEALLLEAATDRGWRLSIAAEYSPNRKRAHQQLEELLASDTPGVPLDELFD